MNKNIRKILLTSSAFLILAGISSTSINVLNVNAKRYHYRTHRIYRHRRARRHVRHRRQRYHFIRSHKIGVAIPNRQSPKVIRQIHRAHLSSRRSYINWYAHNIVRASDMYYGHYYGRAKSYNNGWSDGTNTDYLSGVSSHNFNTSKIVSDPYYSLGVINGIADSLHNGNSTSPHNVSYRTMNHAINLIQQGIKYGRKNHAADVGFNPSNNSWFLED